MAGHMARRGCPVAARTVMDAKIAIHTLSECVCVGGARRDRHTMWTWRHGCVRIRCGSRVRFSSAQRHISAKNI